MFTEIAKEICDLDQPNASSSGTINTDGADLYPAAATSVIQVIAAAIHAGCTFRVFAIFKEDEARLPYQPEYVHPLMVQMKLAHKKFWIL